MKIFEAIRNTKLVLREYATDEGGIFTTFAGKHNTSHTGKKADNIATGEAKPYADDSYFTEYEKKLPNLARLTQRLKTAEEVSSLGVLGPALEELLVLIKAKKPLKVDEKGQWILPMGDNIRLSRNGSAFFIRYVGQKNDNPLEEPNPNTTEVHDKELVPYLT